MKSKGSVVFCENYDEERVYAVVKMAVDSLGGIGAFVKKEEKILLKPNFLYPAPVEKGITTHPAVIKAAIRLLSEENYQFKCGYVETGRTEDEVSYKKVK